MDPKDTVEFEFVVKYRGEEVDRATITASAQATESQQTMALNAVADTIAEALAHAQTAWPAALADEANERSNSESRSGV